MWLRPDALKPTRLGRYTFRHHIRAAVLEGAWGGVLLTSDIVARKTLGASPLLVTVLVMGPAVALLASVAWTRRLEGPGRRRWFLFAGVTGRLVLVVAALGVGPVSFTLLILLSSLLQALVIPLQNAVYQANYSVVERGRLFGRAASVSALVAVSVSLGTGFLYNRWPEAYRVVYPAAGALGFLSLVVFYRVRVRAIRGAAPMERRRNFLADAWALLRRDPRFARYEAAFMVYGTAFMMLQPLIPLFLVDALGADYRQAFQAKAVIFQLMTVALSPLFGRLLDRSDPVRLTRWIFAVLPAFPLMLCAARGLPMTYGAFVVFGTAMAGLNVCWTLGPMHFAGRDGAARYMGVHVTLAGVRGTYAQFLGLLAFRAFGRSFLVPFLISATLFLAAALMMEGLRRRLERAPDGGLPGPMYDAGVAPASARERAPAR